MQIEVAEETILQAKEFQEKNENEIEKKQLIPPTGILKKPLSQLIDVNEKGCRGRYRINYVLGLPKSENECSDSTKENGLVGQIITVCGWSKAIRKQGGGRFCFVSLNDGSCHLNLQVVVNDNIENYDRLLKCGAGCCFRFTGILTVSPVQSDKNRNLLKQDIELVLIDNEKHQMEIYGENLDSHKYPLSKKNHTKEFLREVAHLRPRSYFISSVMRVRNSLALATHLFFQSLGFTYIHTPLITTSDCEGGGEMFTVTTLLDESGRMDTIPKKRIKQKEIKPDNEKREVNEENDVTTQEKDVASASTAPQYMVDYKKDFFSKQAFLTVSGQLSVENYCSSMGDVYTFGPTFRAEKSYTSRHLAEFWMIEPEMAFADLFDNMQVAESYIKYCIQYVMDNNYHDLIYFEENVEEGLISRLKNILEEKFAKITYTNVIELLKKYSEQFEVPVEWGMDLRSEHERFVAEKIFKKPVIVYNYPKDLKAFYMKLNDDEKTVAAMDVLVPQIGEVVGGSQREDNLERLDKMIKEKNLNMDSYWWYRELRKYGSHPHAGFGLGFERLVMMVTGVDNIRDTIPFPRYPGHADF